MILNDDYESVCSELLANAEAITMLSWIVSYPRYLNQYMMEALYVYKICYSVRDSYKPVQPKRCKRTSVLHRLIILEIRYGMTSPTILNKQI